MSTHLVLLFTAFDFGEGDFWFVPKIFGLLCIFDFVWCVGVWISDLLTSITHRLWSDRISLRLCSVFSSQLRRSGSASSTRLDFGSALRLRTAFFRAAECSTWVRMPTVCPRVPLITHGRYGRRHWATQVARKFRVSICAPSMPVLHAALD